MYELILIDADDTLFDYKMAEKHAINQAFIEFNFEGDITEISNRYKEINSRLWLELEMGKVSKDKLKTERFKRLFKEYNLDYPVEYFSEFYLKKLGEGSFLLEEAEDICKYLSEKYKVVIVTNGIKEVQLSRLEKSTIKQHISGIIISEDVGVNKPHPYIFECALSFAKHSNKRSVIMIGDSLTSDIQGGNDFGIDTCWLNLHNQENITAIKPKYQIKQLKGLLEIV